MMNSERGQEERFEAWLKNVELLADKHGLTTSQAVSVLGDINSFQKIFTWVETDKFLTYTETLSMSGIKAGIAGHSLKTKLTKNEGAIGGGNNGIS